VSTFQKRTCGLNWRFFLKKAKNMRRSNREYKKFMVIIRGQVFKGCDLSDIGLSFLVNDDNSISLLNQQKIGLIVAFSLDDINYNYEVQVKITNYRRSSAHEGVYGCQIIGIKLIDLHNKLLSSTPHSYSMFRRSSDRALSDVNLAKDSVTTDDVMCVKIKSSLIRIRKHSVDENISDDLFRELVFKIVNECIEE
jgi:hypothetical protein